MRSFFKEHKKVWLLFVISFVIGVISIPFSTNTLFGNIRDTWSMPLNGKVIVIDPGHGGPDGGAVSKTGFIEKDITLQIALYLRDFLQQSGALVIMTRETDKDLADNDTKGLSRRKTQDLISRVKLIKESNANLLISIHLNAIGSSKWQGAQTFYSPTNEESKKLTTSIQKQLISDLSNTKRLPKKISNVYILKESPIPSALVEAGFLSNVEEAKLLSQKKYQKKLANSIYYGLIKFCANEKLN